MTTLRIGHGSVQVLDANGDVTYALLESQVLEFITQTCKKKQEEENLRKAMEEGTFGEAIDACLRNGRIIDALGIFKANYPEHDLKRVVDALRRRRDVLQKADDEVVVAKLYEGK